MSVPGLHVDQLPQPPLALLLASRLWLSPMSTDPRRGPGLWSLPKHAQPGFASIPAPVLSAHTFRSFRAFSTVYWMESVFRALPSSTPVFSNCRLLPSKTIYLSHTWSPPHSALPLFPVSSWSYPLHSTFSRSQAIPLPWRSHPCWSSPELQP